nr:GxxExxY protein [uncultured Desulfuromonas sp.]
MFQHKELTDKIICCAYSVHNTLGTGFMEKVYENALKIELESVGLQVEQQVPIRVFYKEQPVGEYFADLVVEGKVILELKAVDGLSSIHELQLKNYLKGSRIDLGLLLNFGKKVDVRRKYVGTES